jgi:hypothetical protein
MGTSVFQKVILGVWLVAGLASAASSAPHSGQKTPTDAGGYAAYVVAGSSLMSLGLLFTHIRKR